MSFLLDTNVCIRVLTGRSESVIGRLQKCSADEVKLCSPVKAELLFGARKSKKTSHNLALLKRFFEPFESLPFDDLCAEHYGLIRSDLARTGRLIGPQDLLIAAIARANDLTLITHNTDEFTRVIGLKLEDWEVAP